MIIVFSDIDGTLLARKSHTFAPVMDYITSLRQTATIILATSKTIRETQLICDELGLDTPCIAENGGIVSIPHSWERYVKQSAAVWVPHATGWYTHNGIPHATLIDFLSSPLYKGNVRLFSQMSDDDLDTLTGLRGDRLSAARERYASEPFLCDDQTTMHKILHDARMNDLTIQRGGIFYHCMHKNQNKSEGVTQILQMIRASASENIHTIALGDAPNDFAMMKMVEYPVLIPHQGHPYAIDIPNVRFAPFTAPTGWIDAMKQIIAELAVNESGKESV